MKKRIVIMIVCAVIIAQLITAVACGVGFKNAYVNDMEKALLGDLNIVAIATDKSEDYKKMANDFKTAFGQNTRLTFMDEKADILADSNADTSENHAERPEVQQALNEGYGVSQRVSATTGVDTLYIAKQTSEGLVIRIGRPLSNANAVITSTIPVMVLTLALMLVVAIIFAFVLAKNVLKPFYKLEQSIQEYMSGDKTNVEIAGDYKELEEISSAFLRISKRMNRYIQRVKEETSKSVVILDSIQEGLMILDEDSDVLLINKKARQIFDVAYDIHNVNILHFIRSSDIINKFDYSFKNKKRLVFDYKINESTYRFFTSIVNEPAINANGLGMLVIISDVSDFKKAEEMRKNFATNVSHELKTPLTSISGYAQLITNDMSEHKEKEYAHRIEEESDRLICLINDTLKLSELDHIIIDEHISKINVESIAQEAVAMLEQKAKKRNINIDITGDVLIKANKNRIKELLINLVENAIKYNVEGGSIALNMYDDETFAYISIKDTGIGVPLKEQESIFERFYRAKNSGGSLVEGTGLGLAIAKHIVMLYKGEITLESSDKGSEFIVKFTKVRKKKKLN